MKTNENPENGTLFPPDKRPLMTKSEYAQHRGVSNSAITRAKAEGRISVVTVNGGRELVDVKASDALWSGLTRPRIDAPGPEAPPAASDLGELAGLADDLKAARLRRERAEAEMRELDLDQRCGLLVERDVVEFLVADLGQRLRDKLQALPNTLGPAVQACADDPHAIGACIRDHIDRFLHEFADEIARGMGRLPALLEEPPEQGSER